MAKKSKTPITKEINLDDASEIPLFKSRYILGLILLTAFGLLLRLYTLTDNSLWLDEVSQLNLSVQSLDMIWQKGVATGLFSPVFSYITHVMLLFGNSEFVLRIISVVFGVLTIPLFYYIGTEFKDKNVGLISAAIATVSQFCIYYSQEAYCYATDLFFFAAVILLYLRAIRTNTYKEWILLGVCSAISFWVHYYIFVPLLVLYLHAAYVYRKEIITIISSKDKLSRFGAFINLKQIAVGSIVAAILISPLVFIAIQRYTVMSSTAVTYGTLGWNMIVASLYQFFGYNFFLCMASILLIVVGVFALYTYDRSKAILGGLFLILPLLISVILSAKMTMNPRYLITILPILYTLIAVGIYQIHKVWNSKWAVIAIIAGILLVTAIPLYSYYTTPKNEDWRGYALTLSQSTKSGDYIVALPGYIGQPLDYYYNNSTDNTHEYYLYNITEINQLISIKGNSTIYFVVTPDIMATNPNGDVAKWLNENTKSLGQYVGIYTFIN